MSTRNKKSDMHKFCRAAVGIALGLFGISLITLVHLAFYSVPVADDFGYGAPVHYAIESGAGIIGVFKALAESVRYTYQNWQGTFSSVILFSVQPGAFYEGLYVITPFVMLAAIIAPIFLALGTLREMSRAGRVFIGSVIALLSVQYLPSPADGIFWWNGAAHYIIFWGLGVIAIVFQIRLKDSNTSGAAFYAALVGRCLLSFFVGGGNYSVALVFAVVSCVLTGFAAVKRRNRRILTANALMTAFAVVALFISIIAPGNAVRQAEFERLGAIPAVGMSFVQAGAAIGHMTDIKIIGALMLCVPVFIFSVRRRGFRFQYPFAVLIASFCLFAAMYTPPLYAMGNSEIPRMKNIFYLAYLFFIFGNAFYIAGWATARLRKGCKAWYIIGITCFAGAIVFLVTLVCQFGTSNFYRAYSDLHGEALENYQRAREERVAIYEDKSILPPRFYPVIGYPECFHVSQFLTWSADIIVDGAPFDLLCYRACGGEVTFTKLKTALERFGRSESFNLSDFSKTFFIDGEECVPIRELCDKLGFVITYDLSSDTIEIRTQ